MSVSKILKDRRKAVIQWGFSGWRVCQILGVGFCSSGACQTGGSSAVILGQMAQLILMPLGVFFSSSWSEVQAESHPYRKLTSISGTLGLEPSQSGGVVLKVRFLQMKICFG